LGGDKELSKEILALQQGFKQYDISFWGAGESFTELEYEELDGHLPERLLGVICFVASETIEKAAELIPASIPILVEYLKNKLTPYLQSHEESLPLTYVQSLFAAGDYPTAATILHKWSMENLSTIDSQLQRLFYCNNIAVLHALLGGKVKARAFVDKALGLVPAENKNDTPDIGSATRMLKATLDGELLEDWCYEDQLKLCWLGMA